VLAAIDWVAVGAVVAAVAAAATLSLAIVTKRLVDATKAIAEGGRAELKATMELAAAASEQATAALQQASTGVATLALQVEPRIVPIDQRPTFELPDEIGGSWSTHWVARLRIGIENAGAGVAEIRQVEVQVEGWGDPANVLFPGVLRSGNTGLVRAEFTMPTQDEAAKLAIPPGKNVNVRIHYWGAGERPFQVAFAWVRHVGDASRSEVRLLEAIGHTSIIERPRD
jgi:hypothetical protein